MGLNYLLDTNILSEPTKPHPNQHVLDRLQRYSGQCCTAVTVWHELHYGLARMADSKRKDSLLSYLKSLEQAGLIILPYEKTAGEWLAQERGRLSKLGITLPLMDGEIAAITQINKLTLITRNVSDFTNYDGLLVENWFLP
jgi:tRNA(fMet)-specific endonuclease VapC